MSDFYLCALIWRLSNWFIFSLYFLILINFNFPNFNDLLLTQIFEWPNFIDLLLNQILITKFYWPFINPDLISCSFLKFKYQLPFSLPSFQLPFNCLNIPGKPMSDGTYSRNQLTTYAYVRKGKLLHQWVRRLCVVSGTRLLIYRGQGHCYTCLGGRGGGGVRVGGRGYLWYYLMYI